MTAPYDAGDAPTGDAYRPDPATGPAEPTCPARYERPGGPQPGDRIVECGLPAWHLVDHMETGTGVTWPRVHRDRTPSAERASAVPAVSDAPPGPVSGRSVAHSGPEAASGATAERAAVVAKLREHGVKFCAGDPALEDVDTADWLYDELADELTALIAAQERAKVAAAHCPVCLHPWDTYHTEDGCRFVVNRTADPSSPGVVCYCAVPRAARAVQLARRLAAPASREG